MFDSIKKSIKKSSKSVSKSIKRANIQIKLPMIKGLGGNNLILSGISNGLFGSIENTLQLNSSLLDNVQNMVSGTIDWSGLIEPFKKLIDIAISQVKDEGTKSFFELLAEGVSTHGFSLMMSTPTTKDLTFEKFIKWSNDLWGHTFGLKPYNIWLGKDNWVDETKKGKYYDFMRIIAFSYIAFTVGMNSINSFFGRMVEQKISEHYAFSKLSIQEYQKLDFRGILENGELKDMALFLGFDDRALELVKRITKFYPSVRDSIDFAVREAFEPDDKLFIHEGNAIPIPFKEIAFKLGIDDIWIKRFWHSHWRLLGSGQVLEAFHRGFVNQTELLDYLRRLDYVEKDRKVIMDMSYNLLTRVDIRRVFEQGLISSMDLYNYYGKLGFTEKDKNLMTGLAKQLRFIDTNDLRKLYIERYENGLISENEIKELLHSTGLDNDEISKYLWLSDTEKELEFKIELKKRIESKFYEGDIDFDELVQQLRQLGVSNRELKRIEKNAILFDFRKKKLPTLAELKRYYKKEIIDLNKFVYYALRLGLEKEHIYWILQDIS